MEIDILMWVLAMLFAGITGGLLAGLLGVGGGIVIVPVLYQILTTMNVAEDIRMKIAVGSSLATIIVTSLISSRSHAKKGAVDWLLFKQWSIWIVIGVVFGITIVTYVKGVFLTLVFAIVALIVAIYMMLQKTGFSLYKGFPNGYIKNFLATIIGTLSTLMGIGGGTLSVPILNLFGYNMRMAVGTGAAIGMIIAIPATLGYVMQGFGNTSLPPFSFGYVNMLAVIFIIPMTTIMAPIGAKIAHCIPENILRKLFSIFLIITSLRMFYDLFIA